MFRMESPDQINDSRGSDLENVEGLHVISTQRPLSVNQPPEERHFVKRAESPDIKSKYSVKNEIAQLR